MQHVYFIITQPESWYSFYRSTEGGRLSRPRHCSNGVQPVPKAVYRSGIRDKHNCPRWDSNLGPLTPQSGMLPLGHCDTATHHRTFPIIFPPNLQKIITALMLSITGEVVGICSRKLIEVPTLQNAQTHQAWRQRFPSGECFQLWRHDGWSRDCADTRDHKGPRSRLLQFPPPSKAACELTK